MIRLIYALVIVVLTIGNSVACDGVLGVNGHDCNKGEYWDPTSGKCEECTSGRYCPKTINSNGIAYCCPTDYPDSANGATEIEDCYKTIKCMHEAAQKDCKSYDGGLIDCSDGITSNSELYHFHFEDNQCYTGVWNCNKFSNNCQIGTVTNSALWDEAKGKWNVSQCRCTATYDSESCIGQQDIMPSSPSWYITLNGSINFDSQIYHCTECKTGYYVKGESDINHDNNNDDCENKSVCKCTQIPKGKYLNETCTGFHPPINTNQDICPPSNCPAGKTTKAPGAASAEECKYSNQTKFCDAKGCFMLTDAELTEWGLKTNP